MSRKSLILSLALGLILGVFLGSSYQGSALNELNQQIADLRKENQDLTLWLRGNITFYEEKVGSLEDEINLLRSRLESLQTQANTTVLGIYFSPRADVKVKL